MIDDNTVKTLFENVWTHIEEKLWKAWKKDHIKDHIRDARIRRRPFRLIKRKSHTVGGEIRPIRR